MGRSLSFASDVTIIFVVVLVLCVFIRHMRWALKVLLRDRSYPDMATSLGCGIWITACSVAMQRVWVGVAKVAMRGGHPWREIMQFGSWWSSFWILIATVGYLLHLTSVWIHTGAPPWYLGAVPVGAFLVFLIAFYVHYTAFASGG